MAGAPITDRGLLELDQMPNLRTLNLSQTSVTGERFADLAMLGRLEELHLYNTRLTEPGLAALSKLRNLRSLNLINVPVSAAWQKRLRAELPDCDIAF